MNEQTNLKLIETLMPEEIATICDHTFLNRSEAYRQIAAKNESPVTLRAKAFESFLEGSIANTKRLPYAICVRPEDIGITLSYLSRQKHYGIRIASVVGFPDGNLYTTDFKVAETELALEQGADEIDMVLNYGKLKAGDVICAEKDVLSVATVAQDSNALIKLILETSELNSEQIKTACKIATNAGVDFVKTSTGFSAYGARAEDLKIMRANFEGGIKMSGGVTPQNLKELLYAACGRNDGYLELNPSKIRIGESSLLTKL